MSDAEVMWKGFCSFWGKMFGKLLVIAVALIALSVISGLVWYVGWVNTVENYALAFTFDRYNGGAIEVIKDQGWVVRTPIRYSFHTIDLRPYQITLSANSRVLNAKLVQFNPEGLQTFVKWHGRGAADNLTSMLEILKCYAFDKSEGKDCPFITILQDISPAQAGQVQNAKQ